MLRQNGGMFKMKKGISPLLATVILIGIVVTMALIVNGFVSSMTQNQQERTEGMSSCTKAMITIDSVSCSNNILKVVISNIGETEVGNFTIFAKIGGNILVNNTPTSSSQKISTGQMASVETYTPYTGDVEEVKVYAKTCSGIYAKVTNETIKVVC